MSPKRRMNHMRFCHCHHGQGAHRNGSGPCVGERRFEGTWISCECDTFVPEDTPVDHPLYGHYEGPSHDTDTPADSPADSPADTPGSSPAGMDYGPGS